MMMTNLFKNPVLMLLVFFAVACDTQRTGQVPRFEKHVLLDSFVAEGVAVADINRDGLLDIIAGAYWFQAPDWTAHELAAPQRFEYDKGYSDAFLMFALDVDQDGWIDVIRVGFPGEEVVWHKNPGPVSGHWPMQVIYPAFGNETPIFADMDGDGRPDLIGNDPEAKEVIWLQAPGKVGDTVWRKHTVSREPDLATHQFTHGLGVADLNGDGRKDILVNRGWWEAPVQVTDGSLWTFHPADFGPDCAQMHVLDVNGDGLRDVISSSAHDYGIWWHEQVRQADGSIVWYRHVIDSTFSQSHALVLKDIDGDGHPDLLTGKRYFAHNGHDPGEFDPAVLRWYAFTPGEAPYWRMHQVDDDSGVGLQVIAEDVNGDGREDIVVANKKGVCYFRQH